MNLVVPSFALAVLIGYLRGGRLASLGRIRLRWQGVAIVGLALQFLLWPGGPWPLRYLYLSFALLGTFAVVNRRVAGFWMIVTGITLNLLVIVLNQGMPVSRSAVVASGQADTLTRLVDDGGAKHHLADEDDHLRFLGDVIAIRPLEQAISVGDVFTYGGVMWLIVTGMGSRTRRTGTKSTVAGGGPVHVDG